MNAWVESLAGTDLLFLCAASAGGVFFVSWLCLQFLGGHGHDLHHVEASDVSGQADISFKVLSFQGMSAFLTLFGLFGLAASRELGQGALGALAVGGAAGGGAIWLLSRLFRLFAGLQASGTLDMNAAVGVEGSVYLTIPAGGTGKVQVAIGERLLVLEARSTQGAALATGARVRVRQVQDGQILVVEPLAGANPDARRLPEGAT